MPRRERWTQEGVFEPNELALMGEAYEQVLATLVADPGSYATIPPEQRRALIADAILIGARRGLRDVDRLKH